MNKFYFVTYEYQKEIGGNWQRANERLSVHPLVWLKDMINNHDDAYHILFYDEIKRGLGEMNKFYFVTYEYQKEIGGNWQRANAAMGVHPLVWLKDMIDNYDDAYHILFYDEISEEHFNLIHGWIN